MLESLKELETKLLKKAYDWSGKTIDEEAVNQLIRTRNKIADLVLEEIRIEYKRK